MPNLRRINRPLLAAAAGLVGLAACGSKSSPGGGAGGAPGNPSPMALHVQGGSLVDGTGKTVRLLGINRAGTEYMCATSQNVFDGPFDQASVDAMVSWHVNAVRLPLNEDCWLAINSSGANGDGEYYQDTINYYVGLLNTAGIYVIVDLHWNAPGATRSKDQQPMPDADHAVDFWTSVATYFKSNPMVLFDLYNEPYPMSNNGASDPWGCWLNGCTMTRYSTGKTNNQSTFVTANWQAAGMQSLVTAVRGTGATNVVIASGIEWSNKLDQWMAHKPTDPMNNLAAGFHLYNGNACADSGCWGSTLGAIVTQVPVVTTEVGERDCAGTLIDSYTTWADTQGISYTAWAWNPQACSFPGLITDWTGTPASTFGTTYQAHLLAQRP
jgi:hypothetical protein